MRPSPPPRTALQPMTNWSFYASTGIRGWTLWSSSCSRAPHGIRQKPSLAETLSLLSLFSAPSCAPCFCSQICRQGIRVTRIPLQALLWGNLIWDTGKSFVHGKDLLQSHKHDREKQMLIREMVLSGWQWFGGCFFSPGAVLFSCSLSCVCITVIKLF